MNGAASYAPADFALAAVGLSKEFGGVRAVHDVSFTVPRGQRLAIIGPNGAGKSTLLNLINGQIRPSTGHVWLGGRDVTNEPVNRRARLGLARSFQVTKLFPNLSVWTNAWLAVQGHERWRWNVVQRIGDIEGAAQVVEHLLSEWELWQARDEPAAAISYGQQRKLELVMALAGSPEVLLLDEPSAGLTVEEGRAIVDRVRTLSESVTVVVVDHDMDLIFGLADRVLVLHQGQVIADGMPDVVRADPLVRDIYMGSESEA